MSISACQPADGPDLRSPEPPRPAAALPGTEELGRRVLVLAPSGRDGELACSVLGRAGIDCLRCDDLRELCANLEAGVGAALLSEEAFALADLEPLVAWLGRQAPWSDLPILVLAATGAESPAVAQAMASFGNVTVMERPLRVAALVSAVRTALRARARQYETREHLRELERSERELRDFFDRAAVGLHWADAAGVIRRVNDTELEMLGYRREQYLGLRMVDIHADAGFAERLLRRLHLGETLRDVEARLRCRDGSTRWVLINANVLWEDGRFVHTRTFTRDITDRKQVEEALRQSQRIELARRVEFEALMHAAPAAIWVAHDAQCRRITGNPAAARMIRAVRERNDSATEAARHPPPAVEVYRDGQRLAESDLPMQTAARTRLSVPHQELELRFDDGSSSWAYGNAVPLFDTKGQVRGVVSAFVDITRLKEAERALREADRRKDEFLAMLAHELRNPLAPIQNSLHILQLTARHDPAAGRVLPMMQRQLNHVVRLVDDLMEVSRITRGKIHLLREKVEIAAVVRSALDTSRPWIEAGGHHLVVEVPDEPLVVDGDAVRLAQVLSNLLNNAAKFTEVSGNIRLTVRRAGAEVEIAVADDGRGIPRHMLTRVFDLFTQVEDGVDRAEQGLGIGLTLVRSLVNLHGGSVEAASDGPGRGSELRVRLPLVGVQLPRRDRQDRAQSAGKLRHSILVVDDNRDAADTLGVLLELLGAEVHVVYSGPEAVAALGERRPTVVLLDIGMPDMDGHEVARWMRRQPEHRGVALIALTGWGQEEDRRRSHHAGFDHHLVKPVDIAALQSLLEALEKRPLSGGAS